MKEELLNTAQNALIEIISDSMKLKDFLIAETPEVIEQLLTWKLYESFGLVFLGIVIACLAFPCYKLFKFGKDKKCSTGDGDSACFAFGLVGGVASIVGGTIVIAINLLTALQIYVAPKIFLIEYAAHLGQCGGN